MPDTATEQSGVAVGEQPFGDGSEHLDGVADPFLEDVSQSNEAVAESKSTFDPSLLESDEGILKVAEQFPNLRGLLEKQRKDGENIGRQRREAELRRDQGSVERAQAYHEYLIKQIEETGYVPQDLIKQTPLMVKANEDYIKTEMSKAWVEATLGHFGESEAGVIRSILDQMENNPDGMVDLASKTWEAASSSVKRQMLSSLTLNDVPKEAPIYQEINERVRKEIETETNARNLQSNRRESTPNTPSGVIAGGMSAEEIVNMSDSDRTRWMSKLSDSDFKKAKDVLFRAASS
jgi:hypothetical protein